MVSKTKKLKSYIIFFILVFFFVTINLKIKGKKLDINLNYTVETSEFRNENCEELGQWDDNNHSALKSFLLGNSTHSFSVTKSGLSLVYYDISNLTSINYVKSITFDFSIYNLQIYNQIGYAISRNNLTIFNFTNILQPEYSVSYSFPKNITDFKIENDFLYCYSESYFDGNCTFYILNITNSQTPNLLSVYYISDTIRSYSIDNNFLYLWLRKNERISVLNCTNPTNPQKVHSLDVGTYFQGYLYAKNFSLFTMTGGGYYGNYKFTLSIFDYSNLSNVELVNEYTKDSVIDLVYGKLDFSDCFLKNNLFIFIHKGLTFLNLSDPESIQEMSTYKTKNKNIELLRSFNSYNNAMLICFENSLEIFDYTNHSSLKFVSSTSFGGQSYDVTIKDHYAFVADGFDGLEIIDCYNISNPYRIGQFNNGGSYRKVVLAGDTAYLLKSITNYHNYLEIINISSLTNPTLIDSFSLDYIDLYASYYTNMDIQISEERLYIFYLCDKTIPPIIYTGFGFDIFDISDANSISHIGFYTKIDQQSPRLPLGDSIQAIVINYSIYLVNANSDIEKLDAYDPENIRYLGNVKINDSWKINDLDYEDGYLYLAYHNHGITIVSEDIGFGSEEIIQYNLENEYNDVYGLCLDGSFLYIGEYSKGLGIYDISNIEDIRKVGEYNDGGIVFGITVSNNLAFIADYRDNLEIIHLKNLPYSWPPDINSNPKNYLYSLLAIPVIITIPIVFMVYKTKKVK